MCFMIDDSRIHGNMKIAQDNSAVKTRLLRLMWPSTQRIGKDIKVSS